MPAMPCRQWVRCCCIAWAARAAPTCWTSAARIAASRLAQPASARSTIWALVNRPGASRRTILPWQAAFARILPRLPGEEGDLRRRQAVAKDVEEEEIVQLVGADPVLGRLNPALLVGGDELWADLGVEDGLEDGVGVVIELARADRPADEILHQRLGHAGIDAVMAHLVADPVGRPAQGNLAQIAGADDEAAMMAGEAEEKVGAKASLDVLEGHVVDRLALGEGMAHVGEHLPGGRLDVDLLSRNAERVHQ